MSKMQPVADAIAPKIPQVPFIKITPSDNLCSAVFIRGSFDAKETWSNNIFENSRYFQFMITPKSDRYYNPENPQLTVELISRGINTKRFRKYTGTIEKIVEKLSTFLA